MSENICLNCKHIAVRNGKPWCRRFDVGAHTTVTACSWYQSPTEHMKQQETKEGKPLNIIERIGTPAALEQLAEECCELGQAALKLARKLRGENPTPKTYDECMKAFNEENADVLVCLEALVDSGFISNEAIESEMVLKERRWQDRLDEVKE